MSNKYFFMKKNIQAINTEGTYEVKANQEKAIKLIHNDHAFILRGDKTYIVTGQEVK